jgi:hypothetical protein
MDHLTKVYFALSGVGTTIAVYHLYDQISQNFSLCSIQQQRILRKCFRERLCLPLRRTLLRLGSHLVPSDAGDRPLARVWWEEDERRGTLTSSNGRERLHNIPMVSRTLPDWLHVPSVRGHVHRQLRNDSRVRHPSDQVIMNGRVDCEFLRGSSDCSLPIAIAMFD